VAAIVHRLNQRGTRGRTIATAGVIAFVVYITVIFWTPGQTFDLNKVISFIVVGVTLGSIYGVAASGLVVTYTTSGIFNFAQGAMGMFLTYVYWELKVNAGMQTGLAVLLTVVVAAPLLGAAIERILMRRLAGASLVAQLVVTIGLLVALIGLADTFWPTDTSRSIGSFFGTDGFSIGDTFIPWFRAITIVAGIAIALFLRFILYNTRLGVSMRAVVDNRDLAGLNGARPGRVSMFSWALSASMAALAGIFLAEEFGLLNTQALTLFIVDAFAAAIIGRLRNLPLTIVGGMIIGFSLSFQRTFLTLTDRWSNGGTAIPAIILFLALLFLPQARIEGRKMARAVSERVPSIRRALFGFTVLFVVIAVLAAALSRPDVRRVELAMVVALAMLSLVPLTGWAGQISLAQITFLGIGAWGAFEFSSAGGGMFGVELYKAGSPWGLVIAPIVAVPIGLLMALPALRLQGLYLALASMAFALMAFPLFFTMPEVFGTSKNVPPIKIFGYAFDEPFTVLGIHFGTDSAFLLLTTVLFSAVGLGVVLLRRGRFGRRLIAMRDSEAASATLGVNLLATKLAVFGLSAAIAGFAGALAAVHHGAAQASDFQMLMGLPFLLLLVVGGVGVVSGALLGGFLLQTFTWLLVLFPNVNINLGFAEFNLFETFGKLGPGFAGIGIGRQPEGVIPNVSHDVRERRRKAAEGSDEDSAGAAPPDTQAPTPPAPTARPDAPVGGS
jgi:branched-chain amino acid transport system permease protein